MRLSYLLRLIPDTTFRCDQRSRGIRRPRLCRDGLRGARKLELSHLRGTLSSHILHAVNAGHGYSIERWLLNSPRKYAFHRFAHPDDDSYCCTVKIPPKSLLSPSRTAAVCGGNVLTSQRIVDVVLKAFHAAAASQGCTKSVRLDTHLESYLTANSNLTFGAGGKDKDGKNIVGWGYYEVNHPASCLSWLGDSTMRRL